MNVANWASRLLGGNPPPAPAPPAERRSDGALFGAITAAGPYSGYSVTYDGAMAHAAVYGCIDLLVRLICWQMPVTLGPPTVDGSSFGLPDIIANPHPEPHMGAQHWRGSAIESAASRGYAAGLITSRDQAGFPRQIMPVHPDCVTWYTDRRSGYTDWRVEGREVELWQTGGELWLAPSPRVTPGSPVGKSVLGHAAEKVRLGLLAGRFAEDFFKAGGFPVNHVTVDDPDLTPMQAGEFKQGVMNATRNREPLVTNSDVTIDMIRITAEESQFLATINANVAMVCMYFGIPPESIGGTAGDSLTYATLEGRNLQLLTNTVGAWMQWLEWVMSSLLPGRRQVSLDPESMLRTSISAIYDNAQKGVGRGNTPGFLVPNEARALLGYDPVEGGDRLYVPINYGPADVVEEVLVGNGNQAA